MRQWSFDEHLAASYRRTCEVLHASGARLVVHVGGMCRGLLPGLAAAGVDTVKELKNRVPANLARKIVEINEQKKLTRRVPTEEVVSDWIEQAKKLPAAIEY